MVDRCADQMEFSVLMCVYGKDDPVCFKTAVDSIWIHQTRKPDELVLVVDGPVPEAIEKIVAELAQDPCCKVIRLAHNLGLGEARKIGVSHCSFDYIALMDADDISVPGRFEAQIGLFLSDATLSVAGGQIEEFIDTVDRPAGKRVVPIKDADIKKYLKKRCPFNHMTVMFRASDVAAAGGYQDWHYNEDYWLWIRMFQNGAVFANWDQVLVRVRVGEDMYRRRGGKDYFMSEFRLQNYMYRQGIIPLSSYMFNVGIRFIVQMLLPNRLRGYLFRRAFRSRG